MICYLRVKGQEIIGVKRQVNHTLGWSPKGRNASFQEANVFLQPCPEHSAWSRLAPAGSLRLLPRCWLSWLCCWPRDLQTLSLPRESQSRLHFLAIEAQEPALWSTAFVGKMLMWQRGCFPLCFFITYILLSRHCKHGYSCTAICSLCFPVWLSNQGMGDFWLTRFLLHFFPSLLGNASQKYVIFEILQILK